jgi:outer membrane lipoprotein carrier protein
MRPSLVFTLATTLLASPRSDGSVDVAALLKRYASTYQSSKTLRANFLERYFDNGKEVRSEAGIAYFSKPGKMRWEYVSPEANLYVVDGKWSWFYVPADHTVTRIRAKDSADARTPLALLAGEMKISRICKSVARDADAKPADPSGVVLRCVLRGEEESNPASTTSQGLAPSARSSYALFELNPENGQLLRVVVVDPGGVQVEFRFANWEFDPRVDEAKFHFQVPKGVAIVDGNFTSGAGHPRQAR